MKVEFESYGLPRRDFYDLRAELIDDDKKFESSHLRLLPYDQLHLCCIGNAGAAACTPRLVQQEKAHRRERFLAMEPEAFQRCEKFLRVEGMYDDVVEARAGIGSPAWDHLNSRQQVWAKLNCLYNHIDDPAQRVTEAIELLRESSKAMKGGLPLDVATHYIGRLKGLSSVYPGKIGDALFRQQIEEYRDSIYDFLEENERNICENEQIRDYRCTSDCFRVLV